MEEDMDMATLLPDYAQEHAASSPTRPLSSSELPSPPPPPPLSSTRSPSPSNDPHWYERYQAPSIEETAIARDCLHAILRAKNPNGHGYKNPGLNPFLRTRLELMEKVMTGYSNPKCTDTYGKWMHSSLSIAYIAQKSPKTAKSLRQWIKNFVDDPTQLPIPKYKGRHSVIENEELATDIALHLQSIGKYVTAKHVVEYVDCRDVREKYGLSKKGITVKTAEIWMKRMGYRWKKTPRERVFAGDD
ncbi:hypothetical protein MPER_10620 [Moniliophthora perniciosa FA553]|nr:hypothetical protein MPER_10620 [Moniliophthora perniciosa FA553]